MMGLHSNTVFKNSCIKVPVNPANRLPSAKYERNSYSTDKYSDQKKKSDFNDPVIHNSSNPVSFREFYKSIPDYEEVNHMSNRDFYMTLENLKENKNKLLLKCGKSPVNDDFSKVNKYDLVGANVPPSTSFESSLNKGSKSYIYDNVNNLNLPIRKNCAFSDIDSPLSTENNFVKDKCTIKSQTKKPGSNIDKSIFKYSNTMNQPLVNKSDFIMQRKKRALTPRYFEDLDVVRNVSSLTTDDKDLEFVIDDNHFKKSYSLPTSPVKRKMYRDIHKTLSPKSMKLGNKIDDMSQARSNTKDCKTLKSGFSEQKQFRANPVPIESRIPLYDKIMEDQELRRSITKLQSTAELQAQMKPFTFTEREERQNNLSKCYRLCRSNPQLANVPLDNEVKSFKARPVPKNLFSNYIYDKMREDDFYRALNRRIRAEELLKVSSLPPSMAKRENIKNDHAATPILQDIISCSGNKQDTVSSESSGSRKSKGKKAKRRSRKGEEKKKDYLEREYEQLKREFINEKSPQKANSCNNEELTKKIYGTNSSSSSNPLRVHSASDLSSVNRSNLAAVLRMEATKRKLEAEMMKILEEERFQSEVKWRDSVLRRKPAWSSIKYNHSSELAMRLQTRKEEERLRREQFLHEMEMMYGRVHQQPLMFERFYPPKYHNNKYSKLNIREKILSEAPKSALSGREPRSLDAFPPSRSRKVSINEMAETIGDDIEDVYRSSDDDKESSDIPESIGN